MTNITKAYKNAKRLLGKLDLDYKEDFNINYGFDDTAKCITYVGNKEDAFLTHRFIAIFDGVEDNELCIGDELISMNQMDIDRLAYSNDPAILIELCNKYDNGEPFRSLWNIPDNEEIAVKLKNN